jgi:hypothetical protein
MWLMERQGELVFQYADNRHFADIVADWSGAEVIERKSENEGDFTYNGFTAISRIIRLPYGKVEIALVKGE